MSMNQIKLAIGALALVMICIFGYSYFNGLNSNIVSTETRLTALYKGNQVELDSYAKKIEEATGIANVKSDKLKQVLRDAVSGRYGDGKDELGSKQGQGGSFFSAIKEAYPDIKGQLDLYDRIVDQVFAGREAFKQKQVYLLDQIREYKRWMNDGLVQSRVIKGVLGAPTDLLVANTGKGRNLYGRAALDQMELVVTSKRTNDSFESGEEDAVTVPGAPTKN